MARRILKDFAMTHISAVDNPCQEGATVTIMKRNGSKDKKDRKTLLMSKANELANQLAKDLIVLPLPSMDEDDDACVDFNEAFDEALECQAKSKVETEMWPLQNALRDSVVSILLDGSLDPDSRLLHLRDSAEQFFTALQNEMPELFAEVSQVMVGKRLLDLRKRLLVSKLAIIKFRLEKRDYSDETRSKMADKGHALGDGSFPIANKTDLQNAIKAVGRAKSYAAAKKHIIARAKSLKATDLLPDTWNV